ncbi:MAG: energy-coupling factor transporter transmembrane protein EcfT [Kiritimatiellae bacterium]|nr:energy-coupling factor transporter transmembrane protein EcfT [Kiritimatiellia bacterium]
MPALSARFDPDSTAGRRDVFDIRTRLLISLVVTSATLYLSSSATLAAMSAITFVYLLQTRRYVVIVAAYLLMLAMTLLSLGVIYGSSRLFMWLLPGEGMSRMMSGALDNFHTPFLRSIPSLNVLLAIGLNFSVQGFVGTMKSVRLPRFLFLPLLVFCRFVPEFVDVIRQLRDAVRMRGFAVGFGSAILHPFQTIRLTVIPLVVRTLRMADNLSMAAEMKRVGYAKKPTQLRTLRFRRLDFAALAATVLVSAALCIWEAHIPKPKRMPRTRGARSSQSSQPSQPSQPSQHSVNVKP